MQREQLTITRSADEANERTAFDLTIWADVKAFQNAPITLAGDGRIDDGATASYMVAYTAALDPVLASPGQFLISAARNPQHQIPKSIISARLDAARRRVEVRF